MNNSNNENNSINHTSNNMHTHKGKGWQTISVRIRQASCSTTHPCMSKDSMETIAILLTHKRKGVQGRLQHFNKSNKQ